MVNRTEWRDIAEAPADKAILRPHRVWGTMAVQPLPVNHEYRGMGYAWTSVCLATAWPENAFLPVFSELPEFSEPEDPPVRKNPFEGLTAHDSFGIDMVIRSAVEARAQDAMVVLPQETDIVVVWNEADDAKCRAFIPTDHNHWFSVPELDGHIPPSTTMDRNVSYLLYIPGYSFTSDGSVTQATPIRDKGCSLPPAGWWCSLESGHHGPCPTRPVPGDGAIQKLGLD